MKNKILLLLALAVCAVAVVIFRNDSAKEKPAPQTAAVSTAPFAAPAPADAAPEIERVVPAAVAENPSAPQKVPADKPAKIPAQKNSAPKEPVQDPDARAALSLVGADPEAEAYWLAAINDPTLPANERKDLIEDLNEDGLSDPKHPGPEDLPLIANRIALLENLTPMDQVNADAMQEAYKDLVNLAAGQTPR